MKKKIYLLALGLTTLVACENNKVTPVDNEQTGPISYKADVAPIFVSKCLACHGGSGGYSFENYTQVKSHADDPTLLKAIKHEAGASAMPQGGAKLAQSDINIIENWIQEGALDN